MSHPKPKLTAAGHIEADGVLYRVTDDLVSQRCSVVRDSDGMLMGTFALGGLDELPDPSAVDDAAIDPKLVLAIARLLASPRGALPLQ
jgi:hypothetical protein